MSSLKQLEEIPILKKGGIHIKKKNRGKFTEYCGGKVTEECIRKGKNSSDPAVRKRATFAANARKWKHENGGILKAQEGTSKTFWQKLADSLKENGLAARDARVGAIGAQQVRDLYSEGKNQEAQDLAKQYAKANTTGIALAGGAASAGLFGDLMVTGSTTAADTFIDGDVENFGKNLIKNAAGDLIGHGVGKVLNKGWKRTGNTRLLDKTYNGELVVSPKVGLERRVNTLADRQKFIREHPVSNYSGPTDAPMTIEDALEEAGIPTICIAALPPVVRQTGTPRSVAPLVPMGANAGAPHNIEQQTAICKETLEQLVEIQTPGKIVPLAHEYIAKV